MAAEARIKHLETVIYEMKSKQEVDEQESDEEVDITVLDEETKEESNTNFKCELCDFQS